VSIGNTGATWNVHRPEFAIEFNSDAGYVVGTSDKYEATWLIPLLKGAEALEVPFLNFQRISLARGDRETRVSVATKNGSVTEGVLALKGKDSAGTHEVANWKLGAILQGTTLTRVVTSSPSIILRRQ
jgi:hypothetical protein